MSTFKDFWARYFVQREWSAFIDTKTFKLPQGAGNLSERFQDNVLHYFANYFIVAVASLFLLGVLSQQKPFVISLIILFGLAAVLLLVLPETVQAGTFPIGLKEKAGIIALEWLIAAYFTETFAMWGYCLGVVLTAVIVHASLKQRGPLRGLSSIKDEANFHVEKMGQDLKKLHEKKN